VTPYARRADVDVALEPLRRLSESVVTELDRG
jgi:hypothetical protein